jgi:membrane protein DedA with SNARE-associated domain
MSLDYFIETYGYLAILAGTFVEGETFLLIGGFAAYEGLLELPWVILVAFTGTFCGDLACFFVGKKYGRGIIARSPSLETRADRARAHLAKYQTWLILILRFMYAIRTITLFVVGMSGMSTRRFLLLDAIGGSIWAIAMGVGGYLFGRTLAALLGDIKDYEFKILLGIALAGIFFWFIQFHWPRKRKAASPPP